MYYYIAEADTITRESCEVAAWYTDVALVPGRYPLTEEISKYTGETIFVADVPGTIVADNHTSLLFGNPIGTDKHNEHVGEATMHSVCFEKGFYLNGAISVGLVVEDDAARCKAMPEV